MTMTPEALRALFPAAQQNAYLNAAASSPIPLPVEEAVRAHYAEGVQTGDLHFDTWLKMREETRRGFAQFIGAMPQEVAFVPSTSFGFNVVADLLRQRGVEEVVTLEGEFPSTTIPFLAHGMKLRIVRARPDGTYAPEDVEAAIGPRTGAVALSAVQFASGFRMDIEAVARLCRAKGLLFAVNAAQAIGQMRFNVGAGGIDFLCSTSHKWMFAGYGVGVFYARREHLESGTLPMCGWLSVEEPWKMDNLAGATLTGRDAAAGGGWFGAEGTRFRKEAAALEAGCVAFGPIHGFAAALRMHEAVGVDVTERHIARLQARLRAGLRARGFVPNRPDDAARGSGICVIGVEGSPNEVVRALVTHGVMLSPRGGGVRISTHVFNDEGDVEKLFWALEKAGVRPAPMLPMSPATGG